MNKKVFFFFLVLFVCNIKSSLALGNYKVSYETHIQSIGWQDKKYDGEMSGTTGMKKRIEAIKVKLSDEFEGDIEYRSYIEGFGWEEGYKKDGEISGTTGQARKIEAVRIKLTGSISDEYEIYYRVHVQSLGWLGWAKNDEIAGTLNYNFRIEAVEIKLFNKNEKVNSDKPSYYKKILKYQTHIQRLGWQNYVYDGDFSGRYNKRVEAIKINLADDEFEGTVFYKSFIQGLGWEEEYRESGDTSGTTGKSKRIEAIKIKLTGSLSEKYDIYYRVYIQNLGYLGWAKNDEIAGTINYNYQIEGIEIKLINKGEEVISDKPSFYKKLIKYQSHVQSIGWQDEKYDGEVSGTIGLAKRIEAIKIGLDIDLEGSVQYKSLVQGGIWQDYKQNGEVSGTTGEAKRIEAIKIKLTGNVSEKYDIYYRVHVQSLGWLGWAKNDEIAGTSGYNYRIEGIEIRLIKKGDNSIISDNLSFYKRNIRYQIYMQSAGWQDYRYDGQTSGLKDSDKRMEAIRLELLNNEYEGGIKYKTLIENFGWEKNFKDDNDISGTTGKSKRIEAIQIMLTGDISNFYDIYYRVYSDRLGWLGWTKNGEYAGTSGYGYAIKAIEVKLINKNDQFNDSNKAYFETTSGYFVLASKIGDDKVIGVNGNSYVNNGNIISQLRDDKVAQLWKIKGYNNGFYRIESATNPSLSIGICNVEYKEGFNVCLNFEENLWQMEDLGDGYYSFVSDNLYLNIKNSNLIASDKGEGDNFKFKLISFTKTKTYKGIDISKWQGNINWNHLSLENPEFIIMRVGTGRGNYEKDSKFDEYYYNAKKNNIPVGAYMYSFATNFNEAKKEANLVVDWLKGKKLDLPIFYDIENINQTLLGKDVLTMIAKTFCGIIMDSGYKCGIYANKLFLKDNLYAEELAEEYPIWLAHWTGANNYSDVSNNLNKFGSDYCLTPYKYWQFSSLGVYNGIAENTVDLDFGYDIFD